VEPSSIRRVWQAGGVKRPLRLRAAVGEELAAIIREEIRRSGPIRFSRWMELCLYHPQYGYYMKPRPPGRRITGPGHDADFVTPPTLHPFFAQAVASELQSAWVKAGRPPQWRVQEWGGGEGSLARTAVAWARQNEAGFAEALSWHHAERSAEHRTRIATDAPDVQFDDAGFSLDSPALTPGCPDHEAIVAVEFLDALPFDVYEWRGDRWQEVRVQVEEPGFGETFCDPEAPWFPWALGPLLRTTWSPGQRAIDPWQARRWAGLIPSASVRTVLVVDYGDVSSRLVQPEHADGTVRGFRNHAPADVMEAPGDADITASVPFDAVAWEFSERYENADGTWDSATPRFSAVLESLESFLLRHGILDALNAIDRSTPEGASSYLRLRQLLLPTGLGAAFKVARFDRVQPTDPSAKSA